MPKQYVANERVRHSVTRKYHDIGDVISVDHLSPAQLAALVDRGILREVEVASPTEPARMEPVGPITPTVISRPTEHRVKKEEVKDNV